MNTSANSSPRNSYASEADSETQSVRSSWSSISDGKTPRKSQYGSKSITQRFPSFSRTADPYIIDSETNSLSSTSADQETESSDGPTVLSNLQNVKEIICFSFGTFDRYFISWEDNEGDFHQKSNSLPERLHDWLSSGNRDIPSLQVAFGSGNEFFASDRCGKISSRDIPQDEGDNGSNTRSPDFFTRKDVTREKAHSISNPSSRDKRSLKSIEEPNPKLTRRRTFMGFQSVPLKIRPSIESIPIVQELKQAESTHNLAESRIRSQRSSTLFMEGNALIHGNEQTKRNPRVVDGRRKVKTSEILPWTRSETNRYSIQQEQKTNKISQSGESREIFSMCAGTEGMEPELNPQGSCIPAPDSGGYSQNSKSSQSTTVELLQRNAPRNQAVVIGCMQDFFRVQRNLGDALGYM